MEASTAPADAAVSTTGELLEQQQDQLLEQQQQPEQQPEHQIEHQPEEQQQQQQPLMALPHPPPAAEATATSSSPQTFNAFMQMAHLIRQSSPAPGSDQACAATQTAMALQSQMAQPGMASVSAEALVAAATGLPQMGFPAFEPSHKAAQSQEQLQGISANCLDATQLGALGFNSEGWYEGLVKFFIPMKGYGFITSPSLSRDVHFKTTDIPPELHSCTNVELAGKHVIFQVERHKDGKLKAKQLQLSLSSEPEVVPMQLPVPAAVTALGGIATAGNGCSLQETGQLQGFVTAYDAVGGTGILQAPGIADALHFNGFGSELVPGQHVRFILHWFPDGTAEARGVAPVATRPQNDELFNGAVLTEQVNSLHEIQGFDLQGEMAAAEGKRSSAAALDPTQLLAGAPPLKQQRWDVSEELPGMTAMEALPGMTSMEVLPGMTSMEGLPGLTSMEGLPGMTSMEALFGMTSMEGLSGMAAGATQAGAIPPPLLPTPTATDKLIADLVAGACPTVVPPQPLSGTSEEATARLSGAVKSFNMAKGFGFISCEGIAEDIFFLRSELPGGLATGHAEQGQPVGFEIQLTPDGRYRAARISLE